MSSTVRAIITISKGCPFWKTNNKVWKKVTVQVPPDASASQVDEALAEAHHLFFATEGLKGLSLHKDLTDD
jgi:hypothetical protein